MSLLDVMKDLPKTKKVDMADLEDGFDPRLAGDDEHEDDDEQEHDDPAEQEEVKEEPKVDKKQKPEVEGYQARKKKDWEKRLEEKDAEIARERERADRLEKLALERPAPQAAPKQEERREEIIPDATKDPDGYVDYWLKKGANGNDELKKELASVRANQQFRDAKDELDRMERNHAKTDADYYDAVEHGFQMEIRKQKLLNPNINEAALRRDLETEKVKLAAHFAGQGRDPVASVKEYMVQSYGYVPKTAETEVETDKGKQFDAVRRNKAKSASSLAAGGRGARDISELPERVTIGDFSRMSKAEKDAKYRDKRRG